MKFKTLEVSVNHRVAVIWLAREKVRNAFNEVSIAELTAAFDQFGHDDDVRAIVLAAQGPAFCAGADLDLDAAHVGIHERGESSRCDETGNDAAHDLRMPESRSSRACMAMRTQGVSG